MALDDARGRLYVTCQGSGTIDVLDTAALARRRAGRAAHRSRLPLPTDVAVPTLALNRRASARFGAKVCAALHRQPRAPCCTTDASCGGCPTLRRGAAGRLLRDEQPGRPAQRPARHRARARPRTRSTWSTSSPPRSRRSTSSPTRPRRCRRGHRHDVVPRRLRQRHASSATAGSDRSSSSPT